MCVTDAGGVSKEWKWNVTYKGQENPFLDFKQLTMELLI
jgi:hypothetical protein